MPEIPETKEDIVWKYYNCEKCGTETGYLGELDSANCSKCTLENAVAVKLEGEVNESTLNDLSNVNIKIVGQSLDEERREGTYCLQECVQTNDQETLEKIMRECSELGCNVCLSELESDEVNWPKHYNMGSIQPIDVIENWKLDFRLGNALKYIARAGRKDKTKTRQDLEKALWYIRRFIDKEL